MRIFNRYQIRLEEDEQRARRGHSRIPDDVLRLKKRIFMEMQGAFNKSGKSLKNLFDRVDVDQSNQIEFDEFKLMFEKMGVKLTEVEVHNIFNSVDFDISGKITYPEFMADFEKTVKTDIQTLLLQEKERAEQEVRATATTTTQDNSTIATGMGRQ